MVWRSNPCRNRLSRNSRSIMFSIETKRNRSLLRPTADSPPPTWHFLASRDTLALVACASFSVTKRSCSLQIMQNEMKHLCRYIIYYAKKVGQVQAIMVEKSPRNSKWNSKLPWAPYQLLPYPLTNQGWLIRHLPTSPAFIPPTMDRKRISY